MRRRVCLENMQKKPSKHKEARVGAWEEGRVNSTEERGRDGGQKRDCSRKRRHAQEVSVQAGETVRMRLGGKG